MGAGMVGTMNDKLAQLAIAGIGSGMMVGLGTGRAAARGVRALGERVKAEGLKITCVSTSKATAELATSLGLRVVDFGGVEAVDYLFDGADELDPQLRMLKGGGGAMTRERIVAAAAKVRVNILDESKLVARLGTNYRLPVEVIPLGLASVRAKLRELGLPGEVRKGKAAAGKATASDLVSDNGNFIVDCVLPASGNGWGTLEELAFVLDAMAGVVDHGLFLDEAQVVYIENSDGTVDRRERVA